MKTFNSLLVVLAWFVTLISMLAFFFGPPADLKMPALHLLQAVLTGGVALLAAVAVFQAIFKGGMVGNPHTWLVTLVALTVALYFLSPSLAWALGLGLAHFWWCQALDAQDRLRLHISQSKEIIPRRGIGT